ncbi:DAK2 domain-containing protein [Streptomyces xantholiticus]|uniref:DAK2 domain-containing protein n=1 Tax=Streptomyces xantholiticus TaxID=68285 RepID=UPI0019A27221|nr:DAK2 domain-containing protein [Streptomyces xantholiticus]GGW57974.1 dihydroxyacetone kinase [Streptomyces xantholiticus]
MPQSLDASGVRAWCSLALEALGREREEIDAINVYPVADGDTGTNLYLTVESAAQAVEAVFAAHETGDSAPAVTDAIRAMAHGALIGARGNSGTILAQLLRGMAERIGDGDDLAGALRRAAELAREAVAHPVEGTILTVARAAADAAAGASSSASAVALRAAYAGACAALEATPGQLAVLDRAGVVDAGGRGLVTVLGTLVQAVSGEAPHAPAHAPTRTARPVPQPAGAAEPCADGGPAFEVIYLLEADDEAVAHLRTRLDGLGDSLVVVGGDGLWNVHVHVDDAGAAVEAGVEAGRPYRIRITHFDTAAGPGPHPREQTQRAVVAVVQGEGLADLCRQAGATTVLARPGEPPASGELVDAIRRAHAREVVLLPNETALRHTAAAAAEQARTEGVRVALIPTRSAVQGIAALAVHAPDRRFDEDVVAMTAAAGATRYAELAVAERQSWTSAGVCQAGDVLGLIDGDVAVIGKDLTATALTLLDRMLSSGGELVTLVLGGTAPEGLSARLESHVREGYLAVDTVAYEGGDGVTPLLIGVE